jgi:hypothetical protein
MKQLIFLMLALFVFSAEAQLQTPQASPSAKFSTSIGLTDVQISYNRPRMKGRKIFGEGADVLVPFGKIWRTGANDGTKISFSDAVKVEGIDVPKGEYLIYTWPGAAEWTISLYSDLSLGGYVDGYDKAKEVARFTVKSERLTERVEMLTIQVTDLAENNSSAKVQVAWENTSVKFSVGVEFDSKVMKAIEQATTVNPGTYGAAASYYFENGKDLKKALEWITIACNSNPDAYWYLLTKAKIQKAMGDKAGAAATSALSRAAAVKANNRDYTKMNDDLMKSLSK